jgi:hypothetical protein
MGTQFAGRTSCSVENELHDACAGTQFAGRLSPLEWMTTNQSGCHRPMRNGVGAWTGMRVGAHEGGVWVGLAWFGLG